MEDKEKCLYDYKLGEINNEDMANGMLKAPNKCVAISVTFQSKDGIQMDIILKHDDYIEDGED